MTFDEVFLLPSACTLRLNMQLWALETLNLAILRSNYYLVFIYKIDKMDEIKPLVTLRLVRNLTLKCILLSISFDVNIKNFHWANFVQPNGHRQHENL